MKKAIILLTLILVLSFTVACSNEPVQDLYVPEPTPAVETAVENTTTVEYVPEPEIEDVTTIEEEVDELSDVRVFIGNQPVVFRNQQSTIVNNTPLVPLTETIRAIGANYVWYEEYGRIVIWYEDQSALLHINDTNAASSLDDTGWNFENVRMSQAPILVEGTRFIPILYLERIFGIEMEWNETERIVIIDPGMSEIQERAREEHNELLNSLGIYVQFETEQFIFRSTDADRRLLEEAKNAIYKSIPTILVAFRIEMPTVRIVIELHPSVESMKASSEVVKPGQNYARLAGHASTVNFNGTPETTTGLHHNWLRTGEYFRIAAVIHEFTHTIMKSTYGQPRNHMNEGVTIMVAESYVLNHVLGIHHNLVAVYLNDIRRTNPLPSLDDLEHLPPGPVHHFSHMFMEWMIINFGWDVVLEYLIDWRVQDPTLTEITGYDRSELNNMWLDFLRNYSQQDRDLAISILIESMEYHRAA